MQFMTITYLHNSAVNFISHNIVAVFTNIGFCRVIALRAIGPPTHIRGGDCSVRICKSTFDLSSSPTSSRHLSCNLWLDNNLSRHAQTLPAQVHILKRWACQAGSAYLVETAPDDAFSKGGVLQAWATGGFHLGS